MSSTPNPSHDLIDELIQVVGAHSLPADLESKLTVEGLSKESFQLLQEPDLKELGFTMGPRKLILQWLGMGRTARTPQSVSMSSDDSSTPRSARSVVVGAVASGSSCASSNQVFGGCDVVELLSQYTKGAVNGRELVTRLQNNATYTRQDRIFIVKVVGRHLMNNCKIRDQPNKEEKMSMEISFDPQSHTGHLEAYIRCRRSRNPMIRTLWSHGSHQEKSKQCALDGQDVGALADNDNERILRECRPNASNKQDLLQRMENTRASRRSWIEADHPTITAICRKYPRLLDMEDALREEFRTISGVEKSLKEEFNPHKDRILGLAAENVMARGFLTAITDEYDEDKKSEVAFQCLLAMLPVPPKRGVKKPRLSALQLVGVLYRSYEGVTVDGALARMSDDGILQPTLFRVEGQYYIKLDNSALELESASCFTDALECVFMCFWIFGVEYPQELRLFYGFIEKLIQMKNGSKIKSSVLADFWRLLESARE